MTCDSRLRLGTALIAFAFCTATPAFAQEVAPPPTPNADRLAEEMRTLARDPRNVRALLSAGELSARLNDLSAAAGFFARAQTLDPANPRVLAGQAMVMVRMERPGEALRLFAEAERHGLAMDGYASDRGLAYDLIGAQGHAQRDYRIAMRNADDETIRRFALSLGISGKDDEAMRVLDPLLRRSDRAGWRARAFILAMNGDAAGADKIAASMMGGMGTALAPFFRRLPTLSASDKAFAVHFGELRRTTARIADAQLAPPLQRLGQEPGVAVAAAEAPRRLPPPIDEARRGRDVTSRIDTGRSASARRREREEQARKAAAEVEARRTVEARLAQEAEAKRLADLKAQQERDALAAQQREAERIAAEQRTAREAEARRLAEAQARERAAAELAAREAEAKRLAETQPPAREPAAPTSEPVAAAATPAPAVSETVPARSAQLPPPAPRIGGEDNVIARIIAGITIPASELGVAPMPGRAEPQPAAVEPPAPAPVEIAKAEPPKPQPAAAQPAPEPAKARPEPAKPATGKTVSGKPSPKAGDPKAVAAKDAAAKAKASAKEKAKPDPAKTEPARHWVQVAGGANVGDLPKTWRALAAKAPAEFKGRQPWTTPLRFTNRLLVGPFKTPAEAQVFVNAIGKKGLSGFAWTSEAGQKIEKLGLK